MTFSYKKIRVFLYTIDVFDVCTYLYVLIENLILLLYKYDGQISTSD